MRVTISVAYLEIAEAERKGGRTVRSAYGQTLLTWGVVQQVGSLVLFGDTQNAQNDPILWLTRQIPISDRSNRSTSTLSVFARRPTINLHTPRIDIVAYALRFEQSQKSHYWERPLDDVHVVETFRDQDPRAIYRRLREKGRMMPDGLKSLSSRVADDITLLQRWIAGWSDLVVFEVVPVVEGKNTAQALSAN